MNTQNNTAEDNILPFQVVPGGLPPKEDNWLSMLTLGSFFLARMKNNSSSEVTSFMVLTDQYNSVMLGVHKGTKREEMIWEDPVRFSKMWELVEILHVPNPDEEAGEEENGSSISRPLDVVVDEEPQGQS